MHTRTHRVILAVLTAFYVAGGAAAQEGAADPVAVKTPAKTDTYPLDVCPISGKKLGKMGRVVVRTYEGREVRFCCSSCAAEYGADPKVGLRKLDERIITAQKPGYPLDVCLVSGEKLAEMGKPVDYVHDNQLVRFCCASCVDKLTKAPEEYMAKLHAAYAAKRNGKDATDATSTDAHGGKQGHGTHVGR